MKDLLVMIPAYNEEKNIGAVIEELGKCASFADILVIDDGSRDGTGKVCRALGKETVRHKVNLGLATAIRTGMKYALDNGYSYALQFDGDGQHDPDAIENMLKEARERGNNITIGSRYIDGGGGGVLKSVGRNLITFCIRLTTGKKITDPTSGMRMYDRKVMGLFMNSIQYSPEPDTLAYVMRHGMKVSEIPVVMRERKHGKSYLDVTESIRYMFRMCTSILLVQWFR
jgi:glycosyltransferase involved in cell wall biosynthesis